MIKKILCKIGFHKYKKKEFSLSDSIGTIVKCEWCGIHLKDESDKELKKKIGKI